MTYHFTCQQLVSVKKWRIKKIRYELRHFIKNLTEIEYKIWDFIVSKSLRHQIVQRSYESIADEIGCHRDTVYLILKLFCSLGLMTKVKNGFKIPNSYEIAPFLYLSDMRKVISETLESLGKRVFTCAGLLWSKIKLITNSGDPELLNINVLINKNISVSECINITAREGTQKKGDEVDERRLSLLKNVGIGLEAYDKFSGFSDKVFEYSLRKLSGKTPKDVTTYFYAVCKDAQRRESSGLLDKHKPIVPVTNRTITPARTIIRPEIKKIELTLEQQLELWQKRKEMAEKSNMPIGITWAQNEIDKIRTLLNTKTD